MRDLAASMVPRTFLKCLDVHQYNIPLKTGVPLVYLTTGTCRLRRSISWPRRGTSLALRSCQTHTSEVVCAMHTFLNRFHLKDADDGSDAGDVLHPAHRIHLFHQCSLGLP